MSSVIINTKDFADPNFNPKSWINSVLKNSNDADDGSKNTTTIVTKLQMASESTSRQFDQLSTQILKSMPRILYDLQAISEDAKAAHQNVEEVRKNLGLVEKHTDSVIDNLRRPHVAKTRMEECRMILLEKSDHLNKLREEREQKEAEAKAEAEQQAAAAAAAAAAAEEEAKRVEENAAAAAKAEQEEIERKLAEEKQALREKEKEEPQEVKKPIDELSEEEEEDDDDDYGQVQLPPLRQPEPKTRTTLQQLNAQSSTTAEENNSYLSPQVSSVFKRIGVPLDKFWQS